LAGAVETQTTCRGLAAESTQEELFGSDGGPDAAEVCAGAYDDCLNAEPPISGARFTCPIPIPIGWPQTCDATVEDLSACLNEVAAANPIGVCVRAPDCDAMPWIDSGNAGVSTSYIDASHAEGGSSAPDAALGPPASAFPACERLKRICPVVSGWAAFPC
jgi:hypothetical protein